MANFWERSPSYQASRRRMTKGLRDGFGTPADDPEPRSFVLALDQDRNDFDDFADIKHAIERMTATEYQHEGAWRW